MRRCFLSILFLAVPFAIWAAEAAPREPLRLSLKRAVEIATSPEGNTYIQLSDETVKQAKSRSAARPRGSTVVLKCLRERAFLRGDENRRLPECTRPHRLEGSARSAGCRR